MDAKLYLGDIWTMAGGSEPSRAAALGVRGGRVVATGSAAEVAAKLGPDYERVELDGRTLLPGMFDVHQHASIVCLYGGRLRLRAPDVTDITSLLLRLREASAALEPGEWLVAIEWDESQLRERRAPTRAELDEAVPDRPLFAMHYTCHRALGNSRALAMAGIDHHSPEPSGGTIERDRRGEPNGLLIERAMSRVESLARQSLVVRDQQGFFERLAAHYRGLALRGITHLVDAAVPKDLEALYREARARGLVLVPTTMMPISMAGWLEAPTDVLDEGPSGDGDELLSRGPVKLVFDGAPGCAMCLGVWQSARGALRALALAVERRSLDPLRVTLSLEPTLDLRAGKARTGIRMYAPAEATAIVTRAVERGFAVATHAIGNEAIELALSAYRQAGPRLHAAGAPRLEHATFLDRSMAERMADLGICAVVQPDFVRLPAYDNAPSIPALHNTPLRLLLDSGVHVAGSSDYPVTDFDPLDGIRSAVLRRTLRGEPFEPEQAISLEQAVAMYTREAARAVGVAGEKGSLEPGKRADFVVLDQALDARSLGHVKVMATFLGGAQIAGEGL